MSYVGMITGIIGALTGTAGSIMGYIAYRHSNEIKNADRRLELNKLRNATHVAAVGLIDLLHKSLESRKTVLNARGMFHSGIMQKLQTQFDKDFQRAAELAKQIPNTKITFGSLSRHGLEKKIIELDRTKSWIDELVSVFEKALTEDDETRAEIRANAHSRV